MCHLNKPALVVTNKGAFERSESEVGKGRGTARKQMLKMLKTNLNLIQPLTPM